MTDAIEEQAELTKGPSTPETMLLDRIDDSWELRVRAIDPNHVADLLASIRDQGLLEPLVVDKSDLLIAGNHRYAAIVQLKEGFPDEFRRWFPRGQVPINRLPYKASEHMEEAIAASVAENQKRQDLDPQSVKEYRDKLAKKFKLTVGRPREGQPAVMTMLAQAFQRSPRYLRKVIQRTEGRGSSQPGPEDLVSAEAIPERLYLPKGETATDFERMKPVDRAKRLLLAMKLTEAEFQVLAAWCKRSRQQRNEDVRGQ